MRAFGYFPRVRKVTPPKTPTRNSDKISHGSNLSRAPLVARNSLVTFRAYGNQLLPIRVNRQLSQTKSVCKKTKKSLTNNLIKANRKDNYHDLRKKFIR